MHIALLERIERLERGVLATILAAEGHTYKKAGEKALYEVGALFPVRGNIGAGCVDREIVSQGEAAYRQRRPRIVRIDTSDRSDVVFGYGTYCGGVIEVLVEPIFGAQRAVYRELRERLESSAGPRASGTVYLVHDLESGELALEVEEPQAGEGRYVEKIDPPTPLYVFGATPLAHQIVRFVEEMDFRVHVVDWRESYLETFARLRHVRRHREVESLPDGSFLLVVSHHFERDRDILDRALRAGCAYIGLLSSRGRRDRIYEELSAKGVADEALRRISSPVGLDIRAVSDPEIAVSIVAEVVARARRGD